MGLDLEVASRPCRSGNVMVDTSSENWSSGRSQQYAQYAREAEGPCRVDLRCLALDPSSAWIYARLLGP